MMNLEVVQAAFEDELKKIAEAKRAMIAQSLAGGYYGANKAVEHGHSAGEGALRGMGGAGGGALAGAAVGLHAGRVLGGQTGAMIGSTLGALGGGYGGYKALTQFSDKNKPAKIAAHKAQAHGKDRASVMLMPDAQMLKHLDQYKDPAEYNKHFDEALYAQHPGLAPTKKTAAELTAETRADLPGKDFEDELTKISFAVTEKGHKFDAEKNRLMARQGAEQAALSQGYGSLAAEGAPVTSIGDAARFGIVQPSGWRPDVAARHHEYVAQKHEAGRNAWNPLGGMLTPSSFEEGGTTGILSRLGKTVMPKTAAPLTEAQKADDLAAVRAKIKAKYPDMLKAAMPSFVREVTAFLEANA